MNDLAFPTQLLLKKAGWAPTRAVPTGEWEELLRADGYAVSPAAVAFLASFGGLRLAPRKGWELHFDPREAVLRWAPEAEIADWSRRAGAPLCPVGELVRAQYVLAIDPEGRLHAGFGEQLFRLGATQADALDELASGSRGAGWQRIGPVEA